MSNGEIAFLALVLCTFGAFAVTLFSVSGGFRGQAPSAPARRSTREPARGAQAHA